jgi:hypothetical protein
LGPQRRQTVRVAGHLYPVPALRSAAEQLGHLCIVDIERAVDNFFDVIIEFTSDPPDPHLVDEYLTVALMVMIEQRSWIG